MDEELERKLERAQKLRKRAIFPYSLFRDPDFIEAGDLYCEVAVGSKTIEDQEKYYVEAANTYLMKKDEYGDFSASECYRKLFDLLENVNTESALVYYGLYANSLEKMRKYLNAGQAYAKVADILAKKDQKRSVAAYTRAILTFKKDRASCTYHLKSCLQSFLIVQLGVGNLEGAIETLDQLDIKYAKLCKQILTIVAGRSDFDDVLSARENQLIMSLLNKSKEDSIKDLEAFRSDNYLPESVSKIFDIAIQGISPENDIC